MAIRIIREESEAVLRKKSKEIKEINDKVLELLDDMADTMYEANGVGLAAPQVGMLKRMVVIDIGEGLIELINPVILETEGSQTGKEGCLSVPGKQGIVTRPNYVKAKAINRDGEEFILEGNELMARAICHEIDHLDGKMYTELVEGELMDIEELEEEDF